MTTISSAMVFSWACFDHVTLANPQLSPHSMKADPRSSLAESKVAARSLQSNERSTDTQRKWELLIVARDSLRV